MSPRLSTATVNDNKLVLTYNVALDEDIRAYDEHG